MDRGRSRSQGEQRQPREREPYDEDEQEHEIPLRRRSAQAPMRPRHPQVRQHPRRKRGVWPILLAGCGLGIFTTVLAAGIVVFLAFRAGQGGGMGGLPGLGNTQTFTQDNTQTIPLSTISQIQVCDKIGNVTIKVDPQATTPIVTT